MIERARCTLPTKRASLRLAPFPLRYDLNTPLLGVGLMSPPPFVVDIVRDAALHLYPGASLPRPAPPANAALSTGDPSLPALPSVLAEGYGAAEVAAAATREAAALHEAVRRVWPVPLALAVFAFTESGIRSMWLRLPLSWWADFGSAPTDAKRVGRR